MITCCCITVGSIFSKKKNYANRYFFRSQWTGNSDETVEGWGFGEFLDLHPMQLLS